MLNSNNSTNLRAPPQRRNVPRYHSSDPGKSKGSCCLKCLCCCFIFWFLLIILLGGAVYYLYIVLQPEIPRYNVKGFEVNAFNIQHDFSLHTELAVTVKSENPNQHIGFLYGEDSSVLVTYNDSILCAGKLPTFLQPHANTTIIQILLKGNSEFGSSLQEALMQNREAGKIPLLVEVKAPVALVIQQFPTRLVTVLVNCSLVVDSLSAKKEAKILSSTYHYGVEL